MNRKIQVAAIQKPGPHSLLVDEGRKGCQSFGLSGGGAADIYAYRWVNQLLRNPPNNPAIEVTAGPFELNFKAAIQGAICGAECQARLNGRAIRNWSSFRAEPGDRLTLGFAKSGLRAYLGLGGKFAAYKVFGSVQPVLPDGGNRVLQTDEIIELSELHPQGKYNTMVPWWLIPDYHTPLRLSLYPGYQHPQFDPRQLARLLNAEYRIGTQSNRMGYRLEGPPIVWNKRGITSEGIAYGSVQIPPDGQPIILLNDRQTIGGYPKAGCIARSDCYRLSQARPGQIVQFSQTDLPEETE